MGNLFQELKRRKVYSVATVYIATSWIALQVSDIIFPAFNLPDEAIRTPAIILLFGFPLVLILTWIFEITPDGIRVIQRANTDGSENLRKKDYALGAFLVGLICIVAVQQIVIFTRPSSDELNSMGSTEYISDFALDTSNEDSSDGAASEVEPQFSSNSNTLMNAILRQVSYTGRATNSRISPDGQFIAYFDSSLAQIKIHDLLSGAEVVALPPETFTPTGELFCTINSWSPNSDQVITRCDSEGDFTIFSSFRTGSIGREIPYTFPNAAYRRVVWTNDDRRVGLAPFNGSFASENRFWFRDFDSQTQTPVAFAGASLDGQWVDSIRISPDSSLVIVTRDQLSGVSRIFTGNLIDLSLSQVFEIESWINEAERFGDSIYFSYNEGEQNILARLDSTEIGQAQDLLIGRFSNLSLSRDGKLAVTRNDFNTNVWLGTRQSNGDYQPTQLTFGTRRHSFPRFSNSGDRLAFNRLQGGESNVHTIDVENGTEQQLTFLSSSQGERVDWHPSDEMIAFISGHSGEQRIWLLNSDGSILREVDSSPISTSSSVSWASESQILYQIPGNTTHRFLDPFENTETPLFETQELFDGDIVSDIDNPTVGWNFHPHLSPDGNNVVLFWNREGRGMWLVEKGPSPAAPKQLAGTPGRHGVFQFVNMDKYAGKRIRLSLLSKFLPVKLSEDGIANSFPIVTLMSVPVGTNPEHTGAYLAEDVRMLNQQLIRSADWRSTVVEAEFPEDGGLLRMFCGMSGEGILTLDELTLSVEVEPGIWEDIDIENGSFELGAEENIPSGWHTFSRPLGQHVVNITLQEDRGNVLEIRSLPNPNREEEWRAIRWSDDGTKIYLRRRGDIWSYSLEDEIFTRLTNIVETEEGVFQLDISPDESKIAFIKRIGQSDIWMTDISQ